MPRQVGHTCGFQPRLRPATADIIEHCGSTPIFCDVRDGDLNLDAPLTPPLVTERTKAILPVHLAGQPCDLDARSTRSAPVSHVADTPDNRPRERVREFLRQSSISARRRSSW